MCADGFDGARISLKVFFGVGCSTRAFAKHVERIAGIRVAARTHERLVDRLSEHEMRADQPHRLARCRAHRRQAEAAYDGVENRFRRLAGVNDAGGDTERPRRGRHQESRRFDIAVEPAPRRKLVFDQPVGSGAIGHAQQRLGQHHQREAFLGRKRIGVQKIFDTAKSGCSSADRFDQAPGAGIDALFGGAGTRRLGEEPRCQLFVRQRVGCLKGQEPGIRRVHGASLCSPAKGGEG